MVCDRRQLRAVEVVSGLTGNVCFLADLLTFMLGDHRAPARRGRIQSDEGRVVGATVVLGPRKGERCWESLVMEQSNEKRKDKDGWIGMVRLSGAE